MKRTSLKSNPKTTRAFIDRGRESSARSLKRGELRNGTRLEEERPKSRGRAISPASPAQRAKVRDALCVVCARDRYETVIHPAHLASRAQGGGDDPLDVVALCAEHHRAFDDGKLDLLPHLEPRHRDEVAQCVRHLGLIGALQRLTGERWAPDNERRAA